MSEPFDRAHWDTLLPILRLAASENRLLEYALAYIDGLHAELRSLATDLERTDTPSHTLVATSIRRLLPPVR